LCWSRTAPHVVIQRQELLHTCLQDLLALNPQGPTLTPLLAFLDPSLITCPVDSTPIQQASGSTQQTTQDSIYASSEKHGSRIRLLTDAPVRFTDKELMLRQQGHCAECGKPLPAVGTSWLGRTSSKAGFQCACITTLLDGCQGTSDFAPRHAVRVHIVFGIETLETSDYPQFDCQTSYDCIQQHMLPPKLDIMLDKHVIITTTAAGFLPNAASAALALTSDTPLIACKF